MKISTGLAALFAAALATLPNNIFAQATVNESGETTVYVSTSGSDSNSGTSSSPLRTIQAGTNLAAANNVKGIPTKVLIGPGTYREYVTLKPKYGQTSATITLQAATPGTAVISGSDPISGWSHSSGSIYSHGWSSPLGSCPALAKLPAGSTAVAFRREMIFADGKLLKQVMSQSSMSPGTFYVGSGVVYVWLSDGSSPNNHKMEISNRAHTMEVLQRTNVVVRGLVFQNAASCLNDDSMDIMSSNNVLVDTVKAQWNNFGGIHLSSTNYATVQYSMGVNNGGIGFSFYRNKNLLMQYDESNFNNWRGTWGNLIDYGMGGFKFMGTHTAHLTKVFAYKNMAQGLWFDTDNKNITIDTAALIANFYQNMQVELNQGPITMTNSLVCSGSNGILFEETHNFTVSNTMIYNNGGGNNQAQLFLAGAPNGRTMTDWETGQTYTLTAENITFSGNQVADAGSGQYVFGTYTSGSTWSAFVNSFTSNNNQWYDTTKSNAFDLPASNHVALSGWRSNTGQDNSSAWSLSSTLASTCNSQSPGATDFGISGRF